MSTIFSLETANGNTPDSMKTIIEAANENTPDPMKTIIEMEEDLDYFQKVNSGMDDLEFFSIQDGISDPLPELRKRIAQVNEKVARGEFEWP